MCQRCFRPTYDSPLCRSCEAITEAEEAAREQGIELPTLDVAFTAEADIPVTAEDFGVTPALVAADLPF